MKSIINKITDSKDTKLYEFGGEELIDLQINLSKTIEQYLQECYQASVSFLETVHFNKKEKIQKTSEYDKEISDTLEGIIGKREDTITEHLQKGFVLGSNEQNISCNNEIGVAFGLDNTKEVERAKQHVGELVSGIDKTTKNRINAIIQQGLDEQLTKTEIIKLLKTDFGFSDYRSRLIAKNELGMAYMQGKKEQFKEYQKQTGKQGWKMWISHRDDKTSDMCYENDNQGWIPANSEFASGKMEPLNHIGCRCTVEYKLYHPDELGDDRRDNSLEQKMSTDFEDNILPIKSIDKKVKDIAIDNKFLYGLKEFESIALHYYTGNEFQIINSKLRKGDPLGIHTSYTYFMDSGMNKLPKYSGTVYRGVKDEKLKKIIEGGLKSFQEKGYSSTSTELSTAKLFSGKDDGFIYIIEEANGYNISSLSNIPQEQEILLKRGAIFDIQNIEKGKDGFTYVYVKMRSDGEVKKMNQDFAYNMMASDESDLYEARKRMELIEKDKQEHPEKYGDVENAKEWYQRIKNKGLIS